MKKSKYISLALISAALASCHTTRPAVWDGSHDAVYWDGAMPLPARMVQDTSYTAHSLHATFWRYAFHPYRYHRNMARGTAKAHGSHSIRGGFGTNLTVAS